MRSGDRTVYVYLAGLLVVAGIVVGAFSIWTYTDNSGTNSLATDQDVVGGPVP